MLTDGAKAPEFRLKGTDADGAEVELSLDGLLDGGKKPLVLYFYPRDNTPGCKTEACDFRDNMSRITVLANVAGVSRDSVKSHAGFREKNSLNFPLLSDQEHDVHEKYGAWGEKKKDGKTSMSAIRSTFIISPDGKVARAWYEVKVKGHVDEIIGELKKLG